MAACVLDASLDTPATELSLASCVSAELVAFDSACFSLPLRRPYNKSFGDTGAMPRKSRGFGGWPPSALNMRNRKIQVFRSVTLDRNQDHRSPLLRSRFSRGEGRVRGFPCRQILTGLTTETLVRAKPQRRKGRKSRGSLQAGRSRARPGFQSTSPGALRHSAHGTACPLSPPAQQVLEGRG